MNSNHPDGTADADADDLLGVSDSPRPAAPTVISPDSNATAAPLSMWRRALVALARWFDSGVDQEQHAQHEAASDKTIPWLRVLPFAGMHLMCLGVIWVGFSWFAFWTAVVLYAVRMFAITGFYHRYFSHKSFRTSRPVQFLFGVLGASCVQRGPLWWAAHHRNHHRHADTALDVHSPRLRGFFWSHMGWFLTDAGFRTDHKSIPDLMKFPELRWLDRFDTLVPIALATGLYVLGNILERTAPELGTAGPQLLIWGFFISTIVLFHCAVTINSLAHLFGSRRFDTKDDSRNNWFLALITFGEGWHNNHHFFPGAARQGFKWWEFDLTYYLLRALAAVGIVWDLKPVPEHARSAR